jgi:hypothetical protein
VKIKLNHITYFFIFYFTFSIIKSYYTVNKFDNLLKEEFVYDDDFSYLLSEAKCIVSYRILLSDKFKNKAHLIESIDKIKVLPIDNVTYYTETESSGAYVSLLKGDSNINLILVDVNLSKVNLLQTIIHELYHYVDKECGKNKLYWSQINNIKNLYDINLSNKEYLRYKISRLIDAEIDSELTDVILDHSWNNKEYFLKETEMFVRLQNFRIWLIDIGELEEDESITDYHYRIMLEYGILNLLTDKNDFALILFYLDITKLSKTNYYII